jgi:hypothetical protein
MVRATGGTVFYSDAATTESQSVQIASGGNLGLGTGTPSQKLEMKNGNLLLSNSGTAGELRMQGTGTGYSAFKSGAQGATNITYTLPTAAPTASGQALISSTGGTMSWSDIPTTLPPSGSASGDLSGSYPNPTVTKLQGRAVSSSAPAVGDMLAWNGSAWVPSAPGSTSGGVPAGFMILGATATPPAGYAFAGFTTQTNVTGGWVRKSNVNRYALAAATVNGKIYVMGGNDGSNITVNTNEEYDPATDSWTTKSSTGFTARQQFAVAVVNDTIYALGGYNGSYLNTNEAYDPSTNTWATKSSTGFTARYALAAATVNGKIYALGGWNGSTLSLNQEYDPSTNTWTTKSDTGFTARYALAAATVNGKIYAVGGYNGSSDVSTNQEYDPSTNTWATKSSTGFTARRSLAAASVNGRIYAVGGWNGTFMNTNEVYDPAMDKWESQQADYATMNHHLAAAAVNGKIYVLGGVTPGYSWSSTNEEYTPPVVFYLFVKQ